jgi:hypothetical protein
MVRTLHERRTFLVAAVRENPDEIETIDVTMLARDASLPHRVRISPHSPDAASDGPPRSMLHHGGLVEHRRRWLASRCRARRGGLDRAEDLHA